MKNTLITYEICPENLLMAAVQLTDEEFEFLSKAAGTYTNLTDMNDEEHLANSCISQAFCENEEHLEHAETEEERKYFMKFKDHILKHGTTELPFQVDHFIVCGFIL